MGQAVKLSSALINDARTVGAQAQRSISGQVEYWARLGRSLDPILEGRKALELISSPPPIVRKTARPRKSVLDIIRSIDTPEGHQKVLDYLRSKPFPHFEPHPSGGGLLIRLEADGTRTVGRFRGREFRPSKIKAE
jgi:hypothetical protein